MGEITEKAYGKINLYLDILRKRDDGFHDIYSIMQLVTLCDEVHIETNNGEGINVTVLNDNLGIPMEKNLAYIAAQKFYDNLENTLVETSTRANITITKNIPVTAGLAGGSADAAAVLRGLNKIYGYPYTKKELCDLGMEVGSDVPFCIIGGTHVCKNKGDVEMGLGGLQNFRILIACSGEKESTGKQYQKLDEKFNNFVDYGISLGFSETIGALMNREYRRSLTSMYNVFETLYEDDENVQRTKKLLYDNYARFVMLSGSGPALFAAFDDIFLLEDAQAVLEKEGIKCYPCDLIQEEYELYPKRPPIKSVYDDVKWV